MYFSTCILQLWRHCQQTIKLIKLWRQVPFPVEMVMMTCEVCSQVSVLLVALIFKSIFLWIISLHILNIFILGYCYMFYIFLETHVLLLIN